LSDSNVRFYRPELDTVRFFAFLEVFVIHSLSHDPETYGKHLPGWLANIIARMVQSGGFGVDLFFCLSSFLITSLLIREAKRYEKIDVKGFYIRRILRIWPLYFFAIFLLLFLIPALGGSPISYRDIAAFTFLSGNWLSAFGFGQNNASHLWSISVEEQFYLLWPL
jgi:peptidoglycan/LPS O-acetylase OafA/YrhL